MSARNEQGVYVYADSMSVIGANSSEHVRALLAQLYTSVLKTFQEDEAVGRYARGLMDRLNNFQALAVPLTIVDTFKITRLVCRIEYNHSEAAVVFNVVRENTEQAQDVFMTSFKLV